MGLFNRNSSNKLFEQIFQLKFTSKQLAKQSAKCEREQKSEKLKIKKAIEKGNIEGAKIYSQNCIRKKQEALNYLRLSSRVDGVVSRLETQAKMQVVQQNMSGIVKTLQGALKASSPEKVAMTMQKFEEQCEELDVQAGVMEDTMSSSTAQLTPQDQVNELIQQVAEEHNLEVSHMIPTAATGVPLADATKVNPTATALQ